MRRASEVGSGEPPAKAARTRPDTAVQNLDDVKNSDLTARRHEYHFRTPFLVDMLKPLLKDERDEPLLCLQLNILQLLVPGVYLVYRVALSDTLPLWVKNATGLAYAAAVTVLFIERFILMTHYAAHRSIFHNHNLNEAISWLLSPFFGIPCGIYKLHHCIMHHIENNHALDISSTEKYQRDSWFCFFQYWVHFNVLIWLELPNYTVQTKRYRWLGSLLFGMVVYTAALAFLFTAVSPLGTVWVFMVPHAVSMSAMTFGNWAQHIFVDPDEPDSNYKLTYNCMDSDTNQRTFNDGYHIIHHVNARLHWSELPSHFHATREKHYENGALTFRDAHFMDVGIYVMTGRLQRLVERHYVHLGPKEASPTVEEVVATLRHRLKPIGPSSSRGVARKSF
eukprot:TRINITY_DN112043_c0_g1_i1.p1 TRINITY_DN112043_c0_g1~~TRINITY_DN112043_c0_g1_i1.p1  ORF type:complete len:394 (+),score=48.56 TRINITY_DN112043_c0_g1_i1:163-1344(+)